MQIEGQGHSCERILRQMVFSQNMLLVTTFINFLQREELETIGELALQQGRQQLFYRIVIAKLFMSKYLNRVDRSLFFLFFEDPDFQNIERQTVNTLASSNYPFLEHSYHQFQALLAALQNETQYLQSQPDFQNILQALFFEPDLPLPKMKRQTIGMFCESALQEHLSLLKFPQEDLEELWIEQPLQQLKDRISQELEALRNGQTTLEESELSIRRKMQRIRYRGYEITHKNWAQNLIAGCRMHNLLVLLFAMCSQLVFTFSVLLANIEDPFMRFIEFQLRSAIYRNIVLTLEEKFNFLIVDYTQFYNNSFQPPPSHPPLTFTRSTLSIWAITMKPYHTRNTPIYNYIVAKLREENLRKFLQEKTEKLPSFYFALKEEIELNTFSVGKKQAAYLENDNKLEIQSYFQNNFEMYEVLAKDYLEYMIDFSMNECNVHWCGHSDHVIKNYSVFQEFHENIIQQSAVFYEFIRGVLYKTIPEDIRLSIFREVIKQDLQFIGEKISKPVTLKGVLAIVNKWIKEEVEKMADYAVFGEEGFFKSRIVIDFEEKDNLLNYFSTKAKIEIDCPENLSFFYNIQWDQTGEIESEKGSEHMEEELEYEMYESEEEADAEAK